MKTKALPAACAAFLSLAALCAAQSQSSVQHAVSGGARYHVDHSVFTALPFGDGDISYHLAYEYIEGMAGWRLALDYAPDASGTRGTNTVGQTPTDYVVTPQLHLLFIDQFLRGGGGVMASYMRDTEGEGEWTDIYGQLQLGIHVPPTANVTLDVAAFFVFEFRSSQFEEFDFKNLEYGAWLTYKF